MYYVMSDDDQILDTLNSRPSQDAADRAARMFGCNVWIMQGQHTGIEAKFPTGQDETGKILPIDISR